MVAFGLDSDKLTGTYSFRLNSCRKHVFRTITVERRLRNDRGKIVLGEKRKQKGKPQADSALRDTENVPLPEPIPRREPHHWRPWSEKSRATSLPDGLFCPS